METKTEPYLVDLKSAAPALGFTKSKLWLIARAGGVPTVRVGKKYFFNLDEVKEHLKGKQCQPQK